ncbi:MAG TPA: SRPBCC domain-containing protein [Fimbriimonas sp.]|nr:SRPBCC domain-containing protein [Fimbriimonas sp.]
MKEKIKFEVVYPHSPERVWQALTDPAQLTQWLMPADFKPITGSKFSFASKNLVIKGEVLEAEEGKSLTYTWDDGQDGAAGVVAWKLQPTDGGTKVTLEHQSAVDADAVVRLEAQANWQFFLGRSLSGYLRQPVPIVYVKEEEPKEETTRRAGFRQEEAVPCA